MDKDSRLSGIMLMRDYPKGRLRSGARRSSCTAGAYRVYVEFGTIGDAEGCAGQREEAGCEPRWQRTRGTEVAVRAAAETKPTGDDHVETSEMWPGPDVPRDD